MLQFEALLLRELQKQQNRDEFCDTVLQTRGVSVPVHSCVLSAFSPRLCGLFSSMPVPMAGQRWRIELQAMDARTLLSLVNLIYSGNLNRNQEHVLSAAQSLGIEFPQQQQKEKQDREDAEYCKMHVSEGDERMRTCRVKEMRESGTQTKDKTQTNERETQTEIACVDTQNIQTIPVYLIDQLTHIVNQGPSNAQDAALAMQTIHGHQDNIPTYDILAIAPETRVDSTVSESAFQINPLSSAYEASTSVPVNPSPICSTSVDLLEIGGLPANTTREFQQDEGNITCVNNVLHSLDTGKKEQGCLRGAKGENVFKKPRARSRGGGRVTEVGGRGHKRTSHNGRCGWVAGLAQKGQGGGKVGRKMDGRSTVKQMMRVFQRRQGRGALVKTGEGKGWTGMHASSEGKGDLRPRRPRGRPRLRSYPSVSHSSYDPNCLRTVSALPPSLMEPNPSIDSFLDDFVAGLHSLPLVPAETQHGFMSSTNSNVLNTSHSVQSHSNSAKHAEVRSPEGEMGDILEQFLRTFEQHVGGCNLEMGMETTEEQSESFSMISKVKGTQIDKESEESHLGTIPSNNQLEPSQSSTTLYADILQNFNTSTSNQTVPEKTRVSGLKRRHYLKLENPSKDQIIMKESEFRMLTRSQSLKRKPDTDIKISMGLSKKECRIKRSKNTLDFTKKENPKLISFCDKRRHIQCTTKSSKSKETVRKSKATQGQSKNDREILPVRNSHSKSQRHLKKVRPEAKSNISARRVEKGQTCDKRLKERSYSRSCRRRTEKLENDVGCITVPQTEQLPIKDIAHNYQEITSPALKKRMEILLQIQNEKGLGPDKQSLPVQLGHPLNAATEEEVIKSISSLSTSASSQSKKRSLRSEPNSSQNALSTHSEVLTSSSKSLLLKVTDLSQPTPAKQDPLHDCLLQASESSDEEQLDVLAVSSPIPELPLISTHIITEVVVSSDEDIEIDILE